MSGHGEKLTRKQEQAVAALLSHPTISAAAADAGVSESTLRRWMASDVFAAAYSTARAQLVTDTIGAIQRSATCAVLTLHAIMEDAEAPASARVAAARSVLDLAIQSALEARIAALEAAVSISGTEHCGRCTA